MYEVTCRGEQKFILFFFFFVEVSFSLPKSASCSSIKGVNVVYDTIIVKHSKNLENISSLFSLSTEYDGESIFFNKSTAEESKVNDRETNISFILPFLGTYKALLLCGNNEKTYEITLKTKNFSKTNYSQMICYSKFFETRWCEGKNIIYKNKSFAFYSKANFKFPKQFIAPGARAPPFDDPTQRITLNVVHEMSESIEVREGESFVYGTFFNMFMLWHSIFDFAVPFLTFTGFYKNVARENRTIYLQKNDFWSFPNYFKCLGTLKNLEDEGDFMMKKVTLGIEKFERNPSSDREYDESIAFNYNYKNIDNKGELRNSTLVLNGVSTIGFGVNNMPLIIFIERNTTKRNITNIDEVYEVINKTFKGCMIKYLELENIDTKQQLYYFSRASVVFGVHGSGLTNVVWMKQSKRKQRTHLVEFLPLKYNCRDWYKVASEYSGVKYHSIESNQTILLDSDETRKCREHAATECGKLRCHDILRDQDITVPIPEFEKLVQEIADDINETETFNEFGLILKNSN